MAVLLAVSVHLPVNICGVCAGHILIWVVYPLKGCISKTEHKTKKESVSALVVWMPLSKPSNFCTSASVFFAGNGENPVNLTRG